METLWLGLLMLEYMWVDNLRWSKVRWGHGVLNRHGFWKASRHRSWLLVGVERRWNRLCMASRYTGHVLQWRRWLWCYNTMWAVALIFVALDRCVVLVTKRRARMSILIRMRPALRGSTDVEVPL